MIGAGSAGSRHAETVLRLGHDAVVHDPSASVPPGAAAAPSVEAALAGADAAIVASPSALHAEHALAAIAGGVAVLVEKPLATNGSDARRVAEAAEAAGVLVAAAMNLRHLPALIELRGLLARGELGRPLLATASFGYDLRRWRPQSDYRRSYSARRELGGGILLDAIHELDYLLWLLGPVAAATAMTGTLSELELDVEDAVVACLRFDSGALATLDLNFFEAAYRRGCTVVGTEATVSWEWNASTLAIRGDGDAVVEVDGDVAASYEAEVADFLQAIETGSAPAATVDDGYAAVALADAIRTAALERRETVPVPWG